MAWIVERYRRDGSPYWSVYWRDGGRDTRQQCLSSWNDFAEAEHGKQLVERVGGDKAREILKIIQAPRKAQTLAQYLAKHIDRLTGVEQGTINRYRAYVRNDLAELGEIPLTTLTRHDIARWIADMQEKKASGKTIANKHGFLAGALNAAVRDGHIKDQPPAATTACTGGTAAKWCSSSATNFSCCSVRSPPTGARSSSSW